jgi:hypothetical protein
MKTRSKINWAAMAETVAALAGRGERRINASPEERLAIANNLAAIYRRAGRPLPDIVAALADK